MISGYHIHQAKSTVLQESLDSDTPNAMPLQKFWRRFFHSDVEFQVLKSHSAVELTCYSTSAPVKSFPIFSNRRRPSCQPGQKSKKNTNGCRSSSVGRDVLEPPKRHARPKQLNSIPRYYSHYESFGCSPPMEQLNLLDDDLAMVQNETGSVDMRKSATTFTNFCPPISPDQPKSCVVFCFMECKATTNGLLAAKSMGPDELTAALLAEDEKPSHRSCIDENLRTALTLCHRYRQYDGFKEGVLLKTVESESVHSYVDYASFTVDKSQERLDLARQLSKLNRKSAQDMKYRQQQGAYEELYSIVRKPEPFESRIPNNRHAGHIIIGYKLLTLDNLDRLESTWMQWSGASEILRSAPKQWHLRRITFHRQIFTLQDPSGNWTPAPDGFMYVLLCEFENLMQPCNVVMGCDLVERLRTRGCGHVGIYKVQWTYSNSASDETPTTAVDRIVAIMEECRKREKDPDEYCTCEKDNDVDLVKLSPVISEGECKNPSDTILL